jgi:integrase
MIDPTRPKLLEKVDHRGRIIILLMTSSGMREGAIHSLKLSDIERIRDTYKITVYKNDPGEYYTFFARMCGISSFIILLTSCKILGNF